MSGGLNRSFSAAPNMKPVEQVQRSASKVAASTLDLKVGYNVQHAQFGTGKVTAIEGQGNDKKATIFFPGKGAKNLLLRFANLTVVD
jgi:DNA helicase-2/ATP-dependent DNA helicase PcrA